MPDQLTPAERDAIARYTGPVQIIPRGVSGLPPVDYGKGIDWRVQIKAQYVQPGRKATGRRSSALVAALPPMVRNCDEDDATAARRLKRQGRTMREIAEFLEIPLKRVWKQLNTTQGA